MTFKVLKRKAFAKLNLFLNIIGKSVDYPGKHTLESVMVKLVSSNGVEGLYDDVEIALAENWVCKVIYDSNGLTELDSGENIVIKAGRALKDMAEKAGRLTSLAIQSQAAEINIIKRIPIAAGLGGGSSDAAQVLKALNVLWNLNYTMEELMVIGATIGADIPFALSEDVCCFTAGVGEKVIPMRLGLQLYVLLFNPNKSLSTGDIFKAFAKEARFTDEKIFQGGPNVDLKLLREQCVNRIFNGCNDLELAAVSMLPELDQAMSWVRNMKGSLAVRMSGSGATCFALFDDSHNCHNAMQSLAERYADWWMKVLDLEI